MSTSSQELREALLDPGFYPSEVDNVELVETHASLVFLAGQQVLKIKKPIVLPFLDYGTPARRRLMCHEEVRLNRELAPGIYVGVRGLRPLGETGFELAEDDDPAAVEFAVEMRRYPEEWTMQSMTSAGRLTGDETDSAARRLARFHRDAKPAQSVNSVAEVIEPVVDTAKTLEELSGTGGGDAPVAPGRSRAARTFVDAFVDRHKELLLERQREGFIRECHGDLRAEHVVMDPQGVKVVDRIEFDRALREVDVAADIAFLVMDLERLGVDGALERIVRAYREEGVDLGGPALLDFYASYRAWVRAKVEGIRFAQLPNGSPAQGAARAAAGRYMQLGHRFAWRARRPFLLLVCGVAASGKTTLAERIHVESGVPRLGSDEVRKGLAGVERTHRLQEDMYRNEANQQTYRELGRRAAQVYATDGAAIVDATFRNAADRRAFAEGFGRPDVKPIYVRCRAKPDTLLSRAAERTRSGEGASDADAAVVAEQIGHFEALDEAGGRVVDLPTEGSLEEELATVEMALDRE